MGANTHSLPMNKAQLRKYHAAIVTVELLKKTTATSGILAMPRTLTQLQTNLAVLDEEGTTQMSLAKNRTIRRDRIMAEMADLALEIAHVVAAHADEHQLVEILPVVSIPPGRFSRLRMIDRLWLAQKILKAAEETLPTYPMLPALREKVNEADDAITEPRQKIITRHLATRRVRELTLENERLLRRIDMMLYPLRRTAPEFHAIYTAARGRKPVGRPKRRRTPATEPLCPTVETGAPAMVLAEQSSESIAEARALSERGMGERHGENETISREIAAAAA